MVKTLKKLLLILFLFILSTTPILAKTSTFAIVSDVHLQPSNNSSSFTDSEKNLIFTMESINRNSDIDFTVFLGDSIDKSRLDSLYSFMNIVQKLKKPYYIVCGNTDAFDVGGISKDEFLEIIHDYNSKQSKKASNYYFKAGEDAYALVLDGSSYVVPNSHGRYLPEVLDKCEKILKYRKNDMIFIFQHFPLIPPSDKVSLYTLDDEYYLEKLKKYDNVVLIASGHFHTKKVVKDERGVLHISAPALSDINDASGSGVAYQIVTVNYDKKMFQKPQNIKVDIKDVKI
jgi:3',5'-cyclic AMP phosphodiesterase CpdA